MPQYRKLYTKVTQSFDFNDMPDDFTRCVWLLLPLGLDREGRGIYHAAWIKAKLMPLRQDVDEARIQTAMGWFQERGMLSVYAVDGRAYFFLPTFRKYQGDTRKESESILPPPPQAPESQSTPGRASIDSRVSLEQVRSNSGVGREQVRNNSGAGQEQVRSYSGAGLESLQRRSRTDSDSNADSYTKAEAAAEADSDIRAEAVEQPSAASTSSAAIFQNLDYLKIFKAVTGMHAIPIGLDGPFQRTVDGLIHDHTLEQIITLMRTHFDRWRTTRSPKSGRLYGPTNPGWLEWVLAEPAIPPPEPEPDYKAIAARLEAWEEEQRRNSDLTTWNQ